MYLRIEAVVAIFNLTLARLLVAVSVRPGCGRVRHLRSCSIGGPGEAPQQYRSRKRRSRLPPDSTNPLATRAGRNLCAVLFVAVSLASSFRYDAIWHRPAFMRWQQSSASPISIRSCSTSRRAEPPSLVELGARRGDPDRRLIEQCAQGVLRGLICGRAGDRGQRRGPHCACHWGRRPRYLVGAGLDIAPAAAGSFSANNLIAC